MCPLFTIRPPGPSDGAAVLRSAPVAAMRFPPWTDRPRPAEPDDAALAAALARGDAQALDRLYRREAAAVYRYALAMCGNPAWSADATQEAFVALAARPAGYDPARGPLGAYLCGIARHVLRAQWRQRVPADAPPDDDADEDAGPAGAAQAPAGSPEGLLVRHQAVDALWAALRGLPWAQREAVVLVDLQERPYQEAADIAGIALNTLRTRLHRARARLAERLADRQGDLG